MFFLLDYKLFGIMCHYQLLLISNVKLPNSPFKDGQLLKDTEIVHGTKGKMYS